MGNLVLPEPRVETLPNGINMQSICGGSQEVVQLTLIWTGGTCEARCPEIARLTASLMSEGAASRSGAEISGILDFNGAVLRIYSDSHVTTLTLTSLVSMIADVLPVALDVICDPTFPTDKCVAYRDMEIKNFLLAQSKVSTLATQALYPLIFGHRHPSAEVPTVEEIEAITVADVKDFYYRLITADTCKAFLGGNFDSDVYERIKTMVGAIPSRGKGLEKVIVPFQAEPPQRVDVVKEGAVQAAISMGIPAIDRAHPDYVPLRFTVIALGGYFGSRLMKNIREDKGYTYGIGAYLMGSQEGSYVNIMAQTDKDYVDMVVEEVDKEMRILASEPMGGDELMRLRQHISSSLMEILDSPFSIIDHYRTRDSVGVPAGYFADQVEWVHRLDADTLMHMAAKYLNPDLLRVAVCV